MILAVASSVALISAATASAAGPFKSINANLLSPSEVKLSGGLDVPKRCRAKRTVQIYGANLVGSPLNLPSLGAAVSGKSGSWSKKVAFRDHTVLVLEPKRVNGKLCRGGAMLLELGGPT